MTQELCFLLKVINEEYLESFINEGQLYMNTIDYFRNLESANPTLRADRSEGLEASYCSDNVTLTVGQKTIKPNNITLDIRNSIDQQANIFCMTVISLNDVY